MNQSEKKILSPTARVLLDVVTDLRFEPGRKYKLILDYRAAGILTDHEFKTLSNRVYFMEVLREYWQDRQ